jgi:2-dehydro-3-deoxygluconokinase
MKKIFCFGELLLRYSPDEQSFANASMPFFAGGAELNVATALAKWKMHTRYCTALPENWLTNQIIRMLVERNIDTSAIQYGGERTGIYYLPQGSELKNAGVIYDRKDSSFAMLKPGTIDWDKVLTGCSWFHFSAISPALNETAAEVCLEALKAARAKGLTISIDLNYRSKLWQYDKKPVDIIPALITYCDVVMGNLWSAEKLLGISSPVEDSTGKTKEELIEAAGKSMKAIHDAYQ